MTTLRKVTARPFPKVALFLIPISAALIIACDGGSTESPPDNESADSRPPGRVVDLKASASSTSTVRLWWSAPADSGGAGRACEYDLRYSTGRLDSTSWDSATPAEDEPLPGAPGSVDSMTAGGLTAGEKYFFAIRSADSAGNWSDISANAVGVLPSDTGFTVSMCGVLVFGVECVFLETETGGLVELSNLGSFVIGDTVFVFGTWDPHCISICMQGGGCLRGNSISRCALPERDYRGTWDWVAATGGIAGVTLTPESEGYNERLELDSSREYRYWRADTLLARNFYRILPPGDIVEFPWSPFEVDIQDVTISSDTLRLHGHECADCLERTFVRSGQKRAR